jgi:predicted amidohydrolase YtcJ
VDVRRGIAASFPGSDRGTLNPLMLAWTAVNRMTINGHRNAPEERISVDAALRAIGSGRDRPGRRR